MTTGEADAGIAMVLGEYRAKARAILGDPKLDPSARRRAMEGLSEEYRPKYAGELADLVRPRPPDRG